MKKFLLLLVSLAFLFSGAIAQTSFKTSGGLTYDTLTDGETLYLTLSPIINTNKTVGVIAYADTLSGTATVTAQVQVWLSNETGWAGLGSATAMITAGNLAEVSIPFTYSDAYFFKYRVKFVQTGTASTLVKAQVYFKYN
jgi:hypothetical protein